MIRSNQCPALLPTLLLGVALAGCSDGGGASTPTSQLTPEYSISASPNTVTFVFGRLEAEGFASVRLSDNDALVVSASGQQKEMRWTVDPLGGGYYSGSLSQLDPGALITIALSRKDGGGAPSSVVTMPEAVDLTAPAAGAIKTAGEDLLVTWMPSGTTDEMQIVMRSAQCTRPGAGSAVTTAVVGDPGSATVLVDPQLLPSLASGELCEVDVQVQRVRHGTLDPAYAAGGSILARQLDMARIVVLQP